MVGDNPIGYDVRPALNVAVAKHFLHAIHDCGEQVGAVIGNDALQNGNDSLKAQASINVLGRQFVEDSAIILVVLDKDQVPQLKIAPAAAIHTANVIGVILKITGPLPPVNVYLAARATGAGIAHFPEIILAAKIENVVRIYVCYLRPIARRLLIGFQLALVVLEDRSPEPVFGHPPDLREQLPGPGDGLLLVIVAKGPIAEHLEESVVVSIVPYILQVIMFTGNPHDLLGVGSPRVLPFLQAQEDVLELIHPSVGEQQRGIIARHQRRAGHYGVPLVGEKV